MHPLSDDGQVSPNEKKTTAHTYVIAVLPSFSSWNKGLDFVVRSFHHPATQNAQRDELWNIKEVVECQARLL